MERNPAKVSFYRSQSWRRTRAAYLEAKNYICERCGGPATIVHHKHHITPENVTDPSVTLSFDNLEVLCQTCHNREHFGTGCTAPGLTFDGGGRLRRT